MCKRLTLLTSQPSQKFKVYLGCGLLAAVFFIAVFARLAVGVLYTELELFDSIVGDYIRSFTTPVLTQVAIFVTHLGSAPIVISVFIITAAYLFFSVRHRWETIVLTTSLLGGMVLNETLKFTFQRSRPSIQHLVEADGYSFPSGHAMVAFIFYGMVGYLLWLNFREKSRFSWYIPLLCFGLAIAIGVSRIYLGVHFPSDVIAGFAAGGIWLLFSVMGLHVVRLYKGSRSVDVDKD